MWVDMYGTLTPYDCCFIVSCCPSTHRQMPFTTSSSLQTDLAEILPNVNWDFVSLPCILDIIRTIPIVSKNPVFKKAIKAQFEARRERSSQEAIEQMASTGLNVCEARYYYKYNKSQKNLYPSYADLQFQ